MREEIHARIAVSNVVSSWLYLWVFSPDEFFLLFESLMTMDSIQFANGSDGRQRRKVYDQAYTHQAIQQYYEVFQKVKFRDTFGTNVQICV